MTYTAHPLWQETTSRAPRGGGPADTLVPDYSISFKSIPKPWTGSQCSWHKTGCTCAVCDIPTRTCTTVLWDSWSLSLFTPLNPLPFHSGSSASFLYSLACNFLKHEVISPFASFSPPLPLPMLVLIAFSSGSSSLPHLKASSVSHFLRCPWVFFTAVDWPSGSSFPPFLADFWLSFPPLFVHSSCQPYPCFYQAGECFLLCK